MPKFDSTINVTNRLKFKPLHEFNGLCPGFLTGVEVRISEKEADSKSGYEYGGLKLPFLAFEFQEYKIDTTEPDRFYTHRETPIVSVKNDGNPVDPKDLISLYQEMWKRILHIHQAYSGSANYKTIINTDIPNIDEAADAVTKIKQFETFFTFIANAFNKGIDGKPIYKDVNGKFMTMILKLVASRDGKWLGFPSFVGEGFIERVPISHNDQTKKYTFKTTLELKPNESNVLGATRRGESPGSPTQGTAIDADVLSKLGISAG